MKLGLRALRGALAVSLLAAVPAPFLAAPAQAVAPSGVTTLVAPADGDTVGGNPVFSWTPVAGAVKYKFQWSTSSGFEGTSPVDTVNVNYTPTVTLPTGTIYWRVAPTDGSTGVGAYTVGSFTHVWADGPSLLTPAGGATLTYPENPLLFTWSPLPGAQKYNVQIDDDENFIGATNNTTSNTSFTMSEPQTSNQTFYWRVQGVSGSVNSPWSEVRSYHVEWPATPNLLSPAVGQTVTDVVLKWSPVSGATTYQLQVSQNEDFTNNMAFDVIVKGTSYSPAQTLDNASYFWRVRARDGKTGSTPNLGGWSSLIDGSAAQFTRAWNLKPTLLAPADEDFSVSTPTFRWTAVPYASHYELQVSADSNFSGDTYQCYTNQTSFTPYGIKTSVPAPTVPGICEITQSIPPIDTVIYWRVRGIDAPGNVLGLFSTPFSFMLKHTSMPQVTGPASGATVAVPTLSWNPVLGISRFKVTIKDAVTGNSVSGSPFTTYGNSFTPTELTAGTVDAPKVYRWYVQTMDDQGRVGPSPLQQDQRTFSYLPVDGTLETVSLLTPADGASTPIWPSFSWEPVLGAVSYTVYYGVDGTGLVTDLGTTSATAFTPLGLPPTDDTYRWFVNAIDKDGVVIDPIPEERTFTMTSIPLVTGMTPAKCVDSVCAATPETPRLEWTPTLHTGGYEVHLANDASFTNEIRVYKTSYPSLTPRESLLDSVAGQAYYWFVVPCRNAASSLGCGDFDNDVFPSASAFRKRSTPVSLLSPAEGASVPASGTQAETVTFSWAEYTGTNTANGATQGAKRYRIQVSTVQDFASVIDTQDVDQTTYTPHDKTYPEGPLFWRVGAIDGSNNLLTFSPARSLVKATPPLAAIHPEAGSTSTTPYFQWSPQAHVKSYELEVYKNGDVQFSSTNKVSSYGTASTRLTAFTPTVSMLAGDYAWRVRRLDADGRPGPWTSGGVFTVASAAPALLSPAEGTVFSKSDMLFTWSAVAGAARYKFEADNDAGFASPLVETASTVMTAWAPLVKYADGVIRWRVKVLDGDGNVIATSAVQTIVKDGTAPTVSTKTPTSSIPVSGAALTVTFSEKVTGVSTSTFTMKTAVSGTPVPGTVTPSAGTETTTATFKPTGNLVPGETYTMSLSPAITDLNGNALTPMSWTARTALVVDSAAAVAQAFWDRDTSSSASGAAYLASRTAGAKVSYTFTGTSASILGRRGPDGGYGDVYLDGVKQATATFFSSTVRWKQVVWSKTGLANTTHKVELRVLGTKPSASSATWVFPDAFRYGAVTLEETNAAVTQSFKTVGLAGALGGSYLLETHTASGDTGTQPYITLKFKGTGITWSGIRSTSGGIGQVYVDGVSKAKIDTYGTASTSGQTLWSLTGLSNATHTLKITVTGTKRSVSKGYNVTFDSFRVV